MENKQFMFWLTLFLGFTGIRQFSKKRYFLGFIYLCTFGLFYIGWINDAIKAYHDWQQEKKEIKKRNEEPVGKHFDFRGISDKEIERITYTELLPSAHPDSSFSIPKNNSNTSFKNNYDDVDLSLPKDAYKRLKSNRKPNNYVVFDTETTGFDSSSEHIIEIGAIKYKNYVEVERFSQLVNPHCKLPSEITRITGIKQEDLQDKPDINTVLNDFLNFIEDYPLLAYNASFDVKFVAYECDRCNIAMFNNPVIDVLPLARKTFNLPNYKLKTIKEHLDMNEIGSHRAVDDCEVTNAVYIQYKQSLKKG